MKLRTIGWVGAVGVLGWASQTIAAVSPASFAELTCTSTREYVTTLQFLRSHRELNLPDPEARKVAEEVAAGCTGAGQRFVSVAATLLRSGLSSNDAVSQARVFAGRTDGEAKAFVGVFRLAYLDDGLDLDVGSSMTMARELSLEFKGESAWAYGDFKQIAELCISGAGFDLPKGECAKIALRLAKLSMQGGAASEFTRMYRFLRKVKRGGPALATGQAVRMAEKVVIAGPDAVDNFIEAYQYAVSKKGLKATAEDAFQFAERMALMKPKN